jgi:hypothetical protein
LADDPDTPVRPPSTGTQAIKNSDMRPA